jgi:hypothetical protein
MVVLVMPQTQVMVVLVVAMPRAQVMVVLVEVMVLLVGFRCLEARRPAPRYHRDVPRPSLSLTLSPAGCSIRGPLPCFPRV